MEFITKIDGYKVEERRAKKGCEYDLKVIFMTNGKKFTEKEYKNLEWETVKKVKELLFDYTCHNLNEVEQSRVIPFLTILHEIEEIIFEK